MQDYPSWMEFKRLANMTPAEAQAADALMTAAMANYRMTRAGAVNMPLAELAPASPSESEALSPEQWVAQFLRKEWVVCVSQGVEQRTIRLCLCDGWQIDSDAQEVYVRYSPLVMQLFRGEAPAI